MNSKLTRGPQPAMSNSPQSNNSPAIIGVLLDVSGSMRKAYALDSTRDASVERAHAIITSIINIVKKEIDHHKRVDEIFASVFGLSMSVRVCDLIALLDIVAGPKDMRKLSGHEALSYLLNKHGAAHAEEWVRRHLTPKEAEDLYKVLCFDTSLIPELIKLLPDSDSLRTSVMSGAGYIPLLGSLAQGFAVHRSAAYKKVIEHIKNEHDIVERALAKIQLPRPKTVEYVSNLLDDLNLKEDSPHSSGTLQPRIRKLIDQIKPYIYGGTPMCGAIRDAIAAFQQASAERKVLFILSDGKAEEGDPCHFLQEFSDLGVTIVTCFLTDEHVENQKCLYYEKASDWPAGKATLFEMSSTMRNIDPPVTHLVDVGWTLPASGECRLFVQANSLDVVDELCKDVVSRLTDPCDVVVDILGMQQLATYINTDNASFKAKKQIGRTCYATAVATVFHLAMNRIVGREGGYPPFTRIRDRLIAKFGKNRAVTKSVIAEVSPEYRLRFQKADEIDARQALNHRRPVVASFSLLKEQWDRFHEFFTNNPKGNLAKSAIGDGSTGLEGHAVVLIECTPHCLVFMSSWGQKWGDQGFFRVQNAQVLSSIEFYDVYWTEDDLTEKEKEVYKQEGIERAKQLAKQYPSINDLPMECPECKRVSKVGEFSGNLIEAVCPIASCGHMFRPTNEDFAKSLYLKSS